MGTLSRECFNGGKQKRASIRLGMASTSYWGVATVMRYLGCSLRLLVWELLDVGAVEGMVL